MSRAARRWDPAQYGKFAAERMRPVDDLLARLPGDAPASVYDLGCGDGRVTRLLAERWPGARITGVDSSAAMLDAARTLLPAVTWVEADIADWVSAARGEPADVVFANASLQWLDDHRFLFPGLMDLVAPGGALAVQMPRNFEAPSHRCMREAAEAGPWKVKLEGLGREAPVEEPATYHRILAPRASRVDIWETEYLHVLEGDDPIVEWTRGTGLGPYLEALDASQREAFLADYTARITGAYPKGDDGRTLFPFRRLFIVAAH